MLRFGCRSMTPIRTILRRLLIIRSRNRHNQRLSIASKRQRTVVARKGGKELRAERIHDTFTGL